MTDQEPGETGRHAGIEDDAHGAGYATLGSA